MKYLLIALKVFLPVSIYTISLTGSAGNNITLSSFQGKRILFVNAAVNSKDTPQLRKLQLLQQAYSDSLVVIVCPSDDFGNNPQSDSATVNFINTHYSPQFLLCAKTHVKDSLISPLYKWLGDASLNGAKSSVVQKDYFKYLVDKDGSLIGIFDNSVDPNGTLMKRLAGGEQ